MAYFFDRSTWRFSPEPPGVRVPTPLVLLAVPLAGALFIMTMPALGFLLVAKHLVVETARLMATVSNRSWRSI